MITVPAARTIIIALPLVSGMIHRIIRLMYLPWTGWADWKYTQSHLKNIKTEIQSRQSCSKSWQKNSNVERVHSSSSRHIFGLIILINTQKQNFYKHNSTNNDNKFFGDKSSCYWVTLIDFLILEWIYTAKKCWTQIKSLFVWDQIFNQWAFLRCSKIYVSSAEPTYSSRVVFIAIGSYY